MWIYLMRHAQTQGNLARIVQTPGTLLTDLGHTQAAELATAYSNKQITHIMCSDYIRTQHSAMPVADSLNLSLSLTPTLRERNFGDLRGLSHDDIKEDFMSAEYAPKNGETYLQFAGRVKLAWADIIATASNQAENEHLMVMTHGLVVRCILTEILQLPAEQLNKIDVENTCVTQINCRDINDVPLLCDTTHLSQKAQGDTTNLGAV